MRTPSTACCIVPRWRRSKLLGGWSVSWVRLRFTDVESIRRVLWGRAGCAVDAWVRLADQCHVCLRSIIRPERLPLELSPHERKQCGFLQTTCDMSTNTHLQRMLILFYDYTLCASVRCVVVALSPQGTGRTCSCGCHTLAFLQMAKVRLAECEAPRCARFLKPTINQQYSS